MSSDLLAIQQEINKQVANKETFTALIQTTFKGLTQENVKKAMFEGMIRGLTLKDFFEKNVYAIPFGSAGYSLVTSIDYARKIGARSGVVGVEEAKYEYTADGGPLSCSVTVKKKTGDHIGDYKALVFFKEYYKAGKNGYPSLWDSKPLTMIAKVAEMHALRKACPEELSQSYVEEEMEKEVEKTVFDPKPYQVKLESANSMEELKQVWSSLPLEAKQALETVKSELKNKFEELEKVPKNKPVETQN